MRGLQMRQGWVMSWLLRLAVAVVLGATSIATHAQTVVEYIHTDAMGSPVAVTDANQNVIERSEYEPYGQLIGRAVNDGPGYTGHVNDAATGLSYMQQRYYDAEIGRFLSMDPVAVNQDFGANFNRYWYGNNNPYKFTDPDGRMGQVIGPIVVGGLVCARVAVCRNTAIRVGGAIVAGAFGAAEGLRRAGTPLVQKSETKPAGEGGQSDSTPQPKPDTQNRPSPAPFLPDDPYSPEETSRRQSGTREAEGAPSLDPDSPIPDRGPGSDQGGHEARGRTPHETGERNVNSNEEHSRRPKGNPSGRSR
jgi:RHS repeat-associated protein